MKAKQASVKDEKPSAWIVSPKDRGRKPIKSDNKVYLKDGKNFEIELFNPLQESVLSEIRVNGKPVSSSGLILRPGERFYLDCFLDDKKKFLFKTYSVENTNESMSAISNNGLVEVFFYKEETLTINNWKEKFVPVYYPLYYPIYQNPPYWGGYNGYYLNGNSGTCTYNSTCTTGSLNISSTVGSNSYSTQLNSTITNTGGLPPWKSTTDDYKKKLMYGSLNPKYAETQKQSFFSSEVPKVETGRIEKGELSSQKFTEVDMKFESYKISSVIYQLFPESQKPIETKEIKNETKNETKNGVNGFCGNCGRKRGGENFCPDCGQKMTSADVLLLG